MNVLYPPLPLPGGESVVLAVPLRPSQEGLSGVGDWLFR